MHLLSTRPGGFVEDESIVTRLDQTPADIVILSSADTTLALLSSAVAALAGASADFPSVRLANLLYLRQPASLDLYVDEVLRHARVVIVDHLGSESAWPYGIEQIGSLARRKGQRLAMFSGDLQEDPHLLARSTLPAAACRQLWQYLRSGGAANAREFLKATVYHGLDRGDAPLPPRTLPQAAVHVPPALFAARSHAQVHAHDVAGIDDLQRAWTPGAPTVALEIQHNTEATIDIVGQTDLLCYVPSHVLRSNPERLQSLPIPELRTRRSWLLISHPKAHWSPLMSALRDLTLG